MENLNRVLLENVLPAHVAEHFLARNWKNEVGISYVFVLFILGIGIMLKISDVLLGLQLPTSTFWIIRISADIVENGNCGMFSFIFVNTVCVNCEK